jgi:hypothetical protein
VRVGDFAQVRVVGHSDYDLLAEVIRVAKVGEACC